MISAVLLDSDKQELQALDGEVRRFIALHSDDESRIILCTDKSQLREVLDKQDLADFALLDVTAPGILAAAAQIRSRYPNAQILIIADATIPPSDYIRPGIRPSSLLLRPISGEIMTRTIDEFMDSGLQRPATGRDEYVMETRDGVTRIPYRSIYYFEAAMKRIHVRLRSEEYATYDTIDHLETTLPDAFVRCHRSFIVNRNRVRRYSASEGLLYLDASLTVPVSRSYKSAMRMLAAASTGK